MRTSISRNYSLIATLLIAAGCSASGSIDGPNEQQQGGGPPRFGGAGGAWNGASGGHATGGIAGSGLGGVNHAGAPPAIAGSASGGVPSFGGSSGGAKSGSGGSGSFGAGGKSFGMGGTSTGGTAAGGRAGGGNSMGGAAAGGRAGSGSSTAGTGSAGAPSSNCTEANKTVSNNGTGKHCGFTYEYWKDSGNGTLTLKPDGFSVDWSSVNDLLGRKGQRPGSGNLVVKYSADYQPNGNSYLCVYGWTRNPLVEYYIVDSWGNWRPPGGQGHVGTVSSDDGTYDIYKIAKSGPNIDGNGAFTQYWSVRTAKKTSGTITVSNHINAWKSSGMPMGNFYEVSMTVEGYQSSGKADVKFSMQ